MEQINNTTGEIHMTQQEIEWHAPATCVGAWERIIRSVRTVLKALAKEQVLTDEQLQTLRTEKL